MLFEKPGKENTVQTLTLAVKAAKEKGITKILVASSTGGTALELNAIPHDGIEIICISYAKGHRGVDEGFMKPETLEKLQGQGVRVHSAAHALSGAERALSGKFSGVYPIELVAYTLRMFSQGTKVAVEIALMAADTGLVLKNERVISIGGTQDGCDTALVIRPSYTADFLSTKIDEFICKPALE